MSHNPPPLTLMLQCPVEVFLDRRVHSLGGANADRIYHWDYCVAFWEQVKREKPVVSKRTGLFKLSSL